MWNWFNCYLSGRHEYGVWCEPGAIFLRCIHCGRRSTGWEIGDRHVHATTAPARVDQHRPSGPRAVIAAAPAPPTRVLPFTRAATR